MADLCLQPLSLPRSARYLQMDEQMDEQMEGQIEEQMEETEQRLTVRSII